MSKFYKYPLFSAKNAANCKAPPVLNPLFDINNFSMTPPETLLIISETERSVKAQLLRFKTDIYECSINAANDFTVESPNYVPDKFKSVRTLHVSIIFVRHAYCGVI